MNKLILINDDVIIFINLQNKKFNQIKFSFVIIEESNSFHSDYAIVIAKDFEPPG